MKRLLAFFLGTATAFAAPWVGEEHHDGDFPLVRDGRAAAIVWSAEDFKVVALAAGDLQKDVERVTGQRPALGTDATKLSGPAVLIGTLGHSALIDGFVAAGKIDARELRGAWESFIITTVADPLPGVPAALVIAGSDRRGTAFGVYELSQAIGVSPWYWWADVTPAKKAALSVAAGTRRFGPPSVQYRGIFLNDEDWGLQPWAAKTFEPEVGDIGPKTYAKICELLLRLKANTLWPAMHACTRAFNLYPQNKVVADDYAIVMGSSHAEPMLRNNVTEWTAPHEQYNYLTNREGVRAYWEQRVQENGRYENIYTLGMRGIHDSNMQGPKTDAERIRTLEQIFADQRAMLAQYARPAVGAPLDGARGRPPGTPLPVEPVPQMFCAYKEVLSLYQQGLKVPDDVTIVWPDDNFGYIRNFATAEEQKRSGGFGVYYHISYLGAPMSYLWLETTPPALIWEEMSKAYDHGARKIWIVNVGDLKPAEIGTEFFLQMAWDIKRWRQDNVQDFLPEWAAREFGPAHGKEIGGIMAGYYRLNFERRPEHLQWWLPGSSPLRSPWTDIKVTARLKEFRDLESRYETVRTSVSPALRDSLYELVGYPVVGSGLANERYFRAELSELEREQGTKYLENAFAATGADQFLSNITDTYNGMIAGGKWHGIMRLEPADNQWKSMRIAPWKAPFWQIVDAGAGGHLPPVDEPPIVHLDRYPRIDSFVSFEAAKFADKTDRDGITWRIIPALGVAIFPTTALGIAESQLATEAPRLDYAIDFPAAGEFTLTTYLLPTHPLVAGRGLRFAVGLDDAAPQLVVCDVKDGSPEWAQGVLNNYVTVATRLSVPAAGRHTLRVYGVDAGVVLQKFEVKAVAAPSLISTDAWAGSSVNVLANQSSTLITDGNTQYAAFYSADAHLVLAKRALGSDRWELHKTGYTGNVADAHNTVALAVDGDGCLHVAWDHHAQPLNYARGTAPGSLELGPKQTMTGRHEGSVTYPMFFRQPDGGLLFLYRDGRSGQGNVVLNHYELKAHEWTQVQVDLIDGEGARSAYVAATTDPQGALHLAWNWRESADVATNHDLCYAKSADGGRTWTTSGGAALALPITAATAEYAARIPQQSSLMNPPALTTDAAGRPLIVSYWTPAGTTVPQFQLVRPDGGQWRITQVSRRTTPFSLAGTGTKRPPLSRAAIFARESADKTPEFHLVYRDDERGGKVTVLSCRNLQAPEWRVQELTPDSVGAWEPSADPVQWTRFGQIQLLVEKVSQQDGNDRQPAAAAPAPISVLSWTPE